MAIVLWSNFDFGRHAPCFYLLMSLGRETWYWSYIWVMIFYFSGQANLYRFKLFELSGSQSYVYRNRAYRYTVAFLWIAKKANDLKNMIFIDIRPLFPRRPPSSSFPPRSAAACWDHPPSIILRCWRHRNFYRVFIIGFAFLLSAKK